MADVSYGGDGPLIVALIWGEFAVAMILVFLRFYTNKTIVGEFSWDFYWACATLGLGLVSQICLTISCYYGLGNESDRIDSHHTSLAIMWSWVAQSLAIFAIALSKLTVIAFLLRVQSTASPKARYFLYFLAATNLIINTFETVLVMFQCTPSQKIWNPDIPGDCYVREHVNSVSGFLQGAWNAATDVCLAVYPAIMFYRVQMPLKLKVGVSALMATGLFAAACAVAKTWEIRETQVTQDVTRALVTLCILNWTELWVTLIAASIPAIWPLISFVANKLGRTYNRQDSSYGASRDSAGSAVERSPSPAFRFHSDDHEYTLRTRHAKTGVQHSHSGSISADDSTVERGQVEYDESVNGSANGSANGSVNGSVHARNSQVAPGVWNPTPKASTRVSVEPGQAF